MTNQKYSSSSRLQKIEERKNKRQALVFTFLTIASVCLILFIGLPAFVKLIGALGDVRSSKTNPEKNDTVAPVMPTLMADWEATTSSKITIRGYSEPGSKVSLKVNGIASGDTVANEESSYSFDVTLEQGENEIVTYATDQSSNRSEDSEPVIVLYDSEPPKLEISAPEDGAKFYDERDIVIGGITDVNASVRVNDFIATVDTEGNFARRIQLNQGENEIKIEAVDEAGNKSEKTIKVSYNP